jgi:SnoaL-like protein
VVDNGAATDQLWTHTAYVTCVGPTAKSTIVGRDSQKTYWLETNKIISQRNVLLSAQQIPVNGSLAWEMGQETGDVKMKDGSTPKTDFIATNVYEKLEGCWLI